MNQIHSMSEKCYSWTIIASDFNGYSCIHDFHSGRRPSPFSLRTQRVATCDWCDFKYIYSVFALRVGRVHTRNSSSLPTVFTAFLIIKGWSWAEAVHFFMSALFCRRKTRPLQKRWQFSYNLEIFPKISNWKIWNLLLATWPLIPGDN